MRPTLEPASLLTLYSPEQEVWGSLIRAALLAEIADRMAAAETCDPWPAFFELRDEILEREDGDEAIQLVCISFMLEALDARN